MSKGQIKSAIDVELRKLNETIDMKIVQGLSYKYEARRHKQLLSQSRRMRKAWFGKSFAFMTLF